MYRQIKSGVLTFSLFLAAGLALACDDPIAKAAKDLPPSPYVFMLFYDAKDKAQETYKKMFEKTVVKYNFKVNVFFDPVDISDKESTKYLREEYKVKTSPTTMLLSPNGTTVLKTTDKLKAAEIENIIVSPARRKISDKLKKSTAVVVFALEKPDKKATKKLTAILKDAQGLAREFLGGGKIEHIILPLSDKKESWLFTLMKIPEKRKEKQFMTIVFGNGKTMQAYGGKLSKDIVLDYVQLLAHPCTCTMDWSYFEDLLMPVTVDVPEEE